MRAPEEKFIGERQWQEIKRVLARIGVDADSVQIEQRALRSVVSFRDVFGPRTTVTYFAGDALAAEAREVLDRLEAKLRSATVTDEARDNPEIVQEGAEMVMKPGSGPSRNASKEARDRYWSRLAKVWQSIGPATTPRQRQIDFVVVCTGADRSAVRSYFDRKRASK